MLRKNTVGNISGFKTKQLLYKFFLIFIEEWKECFLNVILNLLSHMANTELNMI